MRTIISAGDIVRKVLETSNRGDDTTMEARLYRELRTIYYRICASHPFTSLRRTIEHTAGTDQIIPANSAGVRWVIDEDDEIYLHVDAGPPGVDRRTFVLNTISDMPSSTALPFFSSDCSISSGENVFTCPTLGNAIVASQVPTGIAVTGTGVQDGTYTQDGILNSKPKFSLVVGVVTYAFAHNGAGLWVYSVTSFDYEETFGIASEADLPPLTGYVAMPSGVPSDIAVSYTELAGIDVVGEFAKLGEDSELYEITEVDGDEFTIDRTYRGDDDLSAADIYVRPPITEEIVLYDNSGDVVEDKAYTIYHWIIPVALRKASDIVMLPSSQALELQLLRSSPEAKEYRPVGQGEIDKALAALKKLNPDNVPTEVRKNRVTSVTAMDVAGIYTGER